MDAEAVLALKPALTRYLAEFAPCMGKRSNHGHLATYIAGQLGPLERKSIEPIALAAGTPPRTLQEFLEMFKWDHRALRDKHQRRVARVHGHGPAGEAAIGLIDETSFVKKGTRTACVQRQYCGAAGKVENRVVSVHLGYATPDYFTLLDGEPYLPEETWHNNPERRRMAEVPEGLAFRCKCRIALDQVRRAIGNGVRLAWLVFDEGYAGKPWFLHELDALAQKYVGEVPRSFRVWTTEPRVRARSHPCDAQAGGVRGRGGARPLMVQTNPTAQVENILAFSPILRQAPWTLYRVMDSTTGPMLWEAKAIPVWLEKEDGLPTRPHHLIVARSVLNKAEIKFFISNAPEHTPVEDLLFVAFSRWRIERLFEDAKGELGMDHFEVRKYASVHRHLILSCLSHAFLAEFKELHAPKSPRADGGPGPHRDQGPRAAVGQRPTLLTHAG
jgi:SRSO17 transposase